MFIGGKKTHSSLVKVSTVLRSTSSDLPTYDLRTNTKDHLIAKRDKQRRSQNKYCNRIPMTFCQKCDATL